MTASDAEVERFRGGKPVAAVLSGLSAAIGVGLAISNVVGQRPWIALLWAVFACLQLGMVYIHGRRRVAMTPEHLILGAGRRAVSIPWSQIQRVRLDWARPRAGDRNEAFHVELHDGRTTGAAASLGQVTASVDQLVAALQRHAEIYGFEVEARRSPSMRRTAQRR